MTCKYPIPIKQHLSASFHSACPISNTSASVIQVPSLLDIIMAATPYKDMSTHDTKCISTHTSAPVAWSSRSTESRPSFQDAVLFRHDGPPTILNKLPMNAWLSVADYLPPSSIAALALTNHYVYSCMQRARPFERIRADPSELEEFQTYLSDAYPEYQFCSKCRKLCRHNAPRRDWEFHWKRCVRPKPLNYKAWECNASNTAAATYDTFHRLFEAWREMPWCGPHLAWRADK
jgi:hypothetical protein